MKKLSQITFLALVMSTGIYAGGDNGAAYDAQGGDRAFVGVEFGGAKGTVDMPTGTYKSDWDASIGLRGGYYNDVSRIYLSLHHINDDEGKLIDGTLNLEAMTAPYALGPTIQTRFFAGGHLGAVHIKADNLNSSDTDFAYGIQGGVLLDFGQNVNLEIGGRYTWSSLELDSFMGTYELQHYYSLYTGVNLTF